MKIEKINRIEKFNYDNSNLRSKKESKEFREKMKQAAQKQGIELQAKKQKNRDQFSREKD